MSRVKINFPNGNPIFKCNLQVRITDINYGGHVGNDSFLGLIHEARLQFLTSNGYSELNIGDSGMIMADAAISFKSECFYPDKLTVEIFADQITTSSFDLLYKMTKNIDNTSVDVLHVKTTLLAFDYSLRKIVPLSENFKKILHSSVGN